MNAFKCAAILLLLYCPLVAATTEEWIVESDPAVKAIDRDDAKFLTQWIRQGHSPEARIKNQMKERLVERAVLQGSLKTGSMLLKVYKVWKRVPRFTDSRGTPLIVQLAGLAHQNHPKCRNYEKLIGKMLRFFPETILDQDRAYVGEGRGVLHQAAANNNLRLIRYLVKKRAGINGRSLSGETPLHLAAKSGSSETIRLLHALHADLNAITLHAKATPLMLASENGRDEIVRLLITLGANRDLKDTFGKTARDRYREYWSARETLPTVATPVAVKADNR